MENCCFRHVVYPDKYFIFVFNCFGELSFKHCKIHSAITKDDAAPHFVFRFWFGIWDI
jgi:hypothetical protein